MSGSAKRRRLEATRRMKLPARPEIPALSRMASTAFDLLFGREDGAADQAPQVIAASDHPTEAVEIGRNGIDGLRFPSDFEQRRGIARRHARQERSFLGTALRHFIVSLKV